MYEPIYTANNRRGRQRTAPPVRHTPVQEVALFLPATPAVTPATETDCHVYRVEEVAKILDISKATVYNMVKDGRLVGLRPARRAFRITRESVQAFLAGGQAVP